VPQVALPLVTPFTCHVTAVLGVFPTVAVNGCWLPVARVAVAGVMLMLTGRALTVRLAGELITPPCDAVMVAAPGPVPVAKPALIVAAFVLEHFHTALAVRSFILLSLKCPVALNCCGAPPTVIAAEVGFRLIDCSTGDAAVPAAVPVTGIVMV
jgi:hypothetical protein